MIQISIYSVLVTIVVLHTVFTHLSNWAFRKAFNPNKVINDGLITGVIITTGLELGIVLSLISYYMS